MIDFFLENFRFAYLLNIIVEVSFFLLLRSSLIHGIRNTYLLLLIVNKWNIFIVHSFANFRQSCSESCAVIVDKRFVPSFCCSWLEPKNIFGKLCFVYFFFFGRFLFFLMDMFSQFPNL